MIIQLIVALILIGLAFWAVRTLGPALKIPEPIQTIILVLMVVVVALYLLRVFGVWSGTLP